jgi:hypothetical protein
MSVFFEEIAGSPSETWNSDGQFEATMRLKCAWSDRYELMARFVNYETPYPHLTEQLSTSNHGVLCRSVSAVPFPNAKIVGAAWNGVADRIAEYEHAVTVVKFGTLRDGEGERTIVTEGRGRGDQISETIEYNVEMVRLAADQFVWDSGFFVSLKKDEAPSKMLVGFDYIFTRHQSLKISKEAKDLIGFVNEEPIEGITPLLRNFTFEPETLLYLRPSFSRAVNSSGQSNITQVFRFAYRKDTWNRFWRPGLEQHNNPDNPAEVTGKGGWDRIAFEEPVDLGEGLYTTRRYNNYPVGPLHLL